MSERRTLEQHDSKEERRQRQQQLSSPRPEGGEVRISGGKWEQKGQACEQENLAEGRARVSAEKGLVWLPLPPFPVEGSESKEKGA